MEMKVLSYIGILFLLTFIGVEPPEARMDESSLVEVITSGDARSLSRMISSSAEIKLSGVQAEYSPVQAEYVLKDFFKRFPPKDFSISHSSRQQQVQTYVGELSTSSLRFQVIIKLNQQRDETNLFYLAIVER